MCPEKGPMCLVTRNFWGRRTSCRKSHHSIRFTADTSIASMVHSCLATVNKGSSPEARVDTECTPLWSRFMDFCLKWHEVTRAFHHLGSSNYERAHTRDCTTAATNG